MIAHTLALLSGLVPRSAGMPAFWAAFVGLNIATMLTYGYDKYAAQTGGRRFRESTLHLLAAAGGTPGAFVAQLLFRHKTRDRRFRLVFWAIAFAQVILLLGIWRIQEG